MNTKDVGDLAEAKVLTRLLEIGRVALLPWGDNQRYDIVYDDGCGFVRAQVKSGRLRNGAIIANAISRNAERGYYQRYSPEDVDVFLIYCSETDDVYEVPIDLVPGVSLSLRVEPTGNGQSKGVKWASDFALPRQANGDEMRVAS